MKVIKLRFLDGAIFTAEASHFSTIYFPAHEHSETKLLMPELAKISVMGKQAFISIDSHNSFEDFITNRGLHEHDTFIAIYEIDGPAEHVLSGYATQEEFEAAKAKVIEERAEYEKSKKAFIEEARKERAELKKAVKLKKAKAKKKK